MFPYIPNTDRDVREMLDALGKDQIEDLFQDIPEALRLNRRLDINPPMSEVDIARQLKAMAGKNESTESLVCFRGAGAYDHYVPSVVKHLISRSEFYTAYTPYQPEISQGTLQAIFEFQTMIAMLTGMDVANASMYDGASATAEAAMLAAGNQKGDTLLISEGVHPQTIETVKTYMRFYGAKVEMIPLKAGVTDASALEAAVNDQTVGVIVQNPNFLGNIEDCSGFADHAHAHKALFIMNVDPISLGLLKTPGEYGADIAVGEGQSFGNPLSFGGPYLGFMASTQKQMRKLPGRIVGESVDIDGKRAYTLTLQAREQHIRRDKATSNICSNQALNALAATITMAAIGKEGLQEMATQCVTRSHYLRDRLVETGRFEAVYTAPSFKEFVVKTQGDVQALNRQLAEKGYLGGLALESIHPAYAGHLLFCVTEKRTKDEMDGLIQVLEGIEW